MTSIQAGLRALWMSCALTLASQAHADVPCASLPNPIYLQVGDTQEPLMKNLGRALADSQVQPMTLVYVTSGSCTNVAAIYDGTPISVNPYYVPSTSADPSWAPSMASPTCTMDPAGHAIDVANSALFVSACPAAGTKPDSIGLFQGPVQGYAFVVPETSTQRAITAEEAYFVFGFGDAGMVKPWNDENFMFIRPTTKSTLLSLAANIRVPAAHWKGQPLPASSDVLNALLSTASPEKSIGILGVEIYDQHRDTVNLLAFRAYGQRYAYFPDSSPTSFDKRNIRDGHYVPWSPTVWLTQVDTKGAPVNADVKYLIDLIVGVEPSPAPDFSAVDLVAKVGLVPYCAMRVKRSKDGGDLSLYEPSEPCGCHYEAQVTKATPAECTACDKKHPCASGVCRYGFCEVR